MEMCTCCNGILQDKSVLEAENAALKAALGELVDAGNCIEPPSGYPSRYKKEWNTFYLAKATAEALIKEKAK